MRWTFLCASLALAGGCAVPSAPPTAASPAGVALVNPGFESTATSRRGDPEGWFSFQHAGDLSYRFSLDTAEPHSGARSLRIDNVGPEPYGAIAQSIEAKEHAGKVVRFSGWLRTRDATDTGAVLTILTLANGAPITQNFMADAPVKGTTAWKRYTITLPVPKNAERVEIGAMMQGKGSLWLDDVELEFAPP